MKQIVTMLLLLVLVSSISFGQRRSDGTKLGLQYNYLMPANEFPFDKGKNSWLARGYLRFGLATYLDAEVGAGYGEYSGETFATNDNYKTMLFPVDFRLLLKFNKGRTFPYLFGGIGGLYYKVNNLPTNAGFPSPKMDLKDKGVSGIIPGGLGVQISLSRSVALDLNFGAAMSTTDNLNYYHDGDAYDSYYFGALSLVFGSDLPSDDDMDGLTNEQEEQLGTNPLNPDTDGDGLTDGDEVNKYTTNPLKADTDGDGLNDGDEVLKYHTDPLKADTDGDGLSDGDEVLKYHTDPLKADTDGDGLNDGDEVLKYHTDPLKADTDGDGLNDGDEVLKYHTDPLKADTDGDGLNDGDEVLKYHTDPLNVDTDGGSVPDGVEVNRGTNPLDPNDDVVKMKVGVPIILEGITFKTGSAEITPESEPNLQKALETFKGNPDILVEIAGHTDNVGSAKLNKKLSLARAESVKKWLVSHGVDGSRLSTKGYGKDKPIVKNDTPENRQKNRRIEFIRTK